MTQVVGVQVPRWAFTSLICGGTFSEALPDLGTIQSCEQQQQLTPVQTRYRSVPREFVDPPKALNPTEKLLQKLLQYQPKFLQYLLLDSLLKL